MGLNTITGILTREGRFGYIEERELCDHRDRDWSDIALSQRMLRSASNY